MKTRNCSLAVAVFAVMVAGALGAVALQEEREMKQRQPGTMAMARTMPEPHRVLATAYHQNLAAFTKALNEQMAGAHSVNVEFARTAVAEMRRSFDQMQQHHQEHMKTLTAEMSASMGAMMQQMQTHEAELNTQLTALEQELQSASPDAQKVSSMAAGIQTHLDAMSTMRQGSPDTR